MCVFLFFPFILLDANIAVPLWQSFAMDEKKNFFINENWNWINMKTERVWVKNILVVTVTDWRNCVCTVQSNRTKFIAMHVHDIVNCQSEYIFGAENSDVYIRRQWKTPNVHVINSTFIHGYTDNPFWNMSYKRRRRRRRKGFLFQNNHHRWGFP